MGENLEHEGDLEIQLKLNCKEKMKLERAEFVNC